MINYLWHDYKGFDHGDRADQLPLPGHAELVHAAVGLIVKRPPGLTTSTADKIGGQVRQVHRRRASSRTWRSGRTRRRIDNPLLCEEDGPVYQLRRWYEQFYVDVGRRHRRTWSRGSSSRSTPPGRSRPGRPRSPRTWPPAAAGRRPTGDAGRGRRRRGRLRRGGGPAVRADERLRRPATVACDRCGAAVQVAKFSPQHTSVQWTRTRCAACARVRHAGRRRRADAR